MSAFALKYAKAGRWILAVPCYLQLDTSHRKELREKLDARENKALSLAADDWITAHKWL